MLTAEMLDDAQAAFFNDINAGVFKAHALKSAVSAAFVHVERKLGELNTGLENERQRRREDALVIRHAMFRGSPSRNDVEGLISYLARWHTSFSVNQLARVTGDDYGHSLSILQEWMQANPDRLIFDPYAHCFNTPRAIKRANRPATNGSAA